MIRIWRVLPGVALGPGVALLLAIGPVRAASPGDALAQLEAAGRPDLVKHWRDASALERRARELEYQRPPASVGLYLGAASLFEAVANEQPRLAQACWRSARTWWLAGDTLPLAAKAERLRFFERSDLLSSRGLEVDPDCAECMLWKFAAMGRLRTTRGIWTGIRQLPDMARLLDRAIALEPTYADNENNSTIGNLHYSSAIFYRVFPDWFWIGWVLGVKGDKERALAHSRSALAIHPSRLDYQIEVGTQLLCLGTTRGDPELLAEGSEVLQAAVLREAHTQDDERELAAARVMLVQPSKACGYSGDTWIEIDREQAQRAAG